MKRERHLRAFAVAATKVRNELPFDMGNEGNFISFADRHHFKAAFDPMNLDIRYSIFLCAVCEKIHTFESTSVLSV